jgi:hypothetical protein
VAAHRGIPFAGLNALFLRAFLQIQLTVSIEHRHVDGTMAQAGIAVNLFAPAQPDHPVFFVDDLEPLLLGIASSLHRCNLASLQLGML